MNWQHPDHGWAPSFCKSKSAKIQPEPRELKIPPGTVLHRPWWLAAECSQIACDVGHGRARGVGEQSEEVVGVPFYHLPVSCCSQICQIWGAGGRKEAETTGPGALGCRRKSLAASDRLSPTTKEAETAGAGASVRRWSPRVSGAGVSCSCRGSLIAVAAELRHRWKGWGGGSRIDLVREKQIDGAWCIYAGMRTARNTQSRDEADVQV